MARVFSVNSRNDIFASEGGRLAISTNLQAVLQHCEHAAKAQANEMVLALDRGVNTFQSVWDGSINVLQFEAFVRRQLLRVNGVVSIDEFDARAVSNTIQYTATIRTIYGTGVVSNQL